MVSIIFFIVAEIIALQEFVGRQRSERLVRISCFTGLAVDRMVAWSHHCDAIKHDILKMANDSSQIFTVIRAWARCNDSTLDILLFASGSAGFVASHPLHSAQPLRPAAK